MLADEKANRRTWEIATLLALRDRLRAGNVWVEGSRQWRAVEDQLITPALFRSMRRVWSAAGRRAGNCTQLARRAP